MTRQVTAGQPITVVARSQVGGFIPDAPLVFDGPVYTDPECTQTCSETRANGAGEFVFYAPPDTVLQVTVGDPIAGDQEPIQVVGTTWRPGGLAAVQPEETPAVHEQSAVSELVSDASLVGAPSSPFPEDQGGALAAVGVDRAQNVPPGPDQPSPDGTAATDPDAVAPPEDAEQVTPQPVEITSDAAEQG